MVNSVLVESSSLLPEATKNVLKHTFGCSRYDLKEACDKALSLISEMGSKIGALGQVQEELNEVTDLDDPKYCQFKLIMAIIKAMEEQN